MLPTPAPAFEPCVGRIPNQSEPASLGRSLDRLSSLPTGGAELHELATAPGGVRELIPAGQVSLAELKGWRQGKHVTVGRSRACTHAVCTVRR